MEERDDPQLVQLARIRWRIDALDEWRKDLDGRIAVVESQVNDLRFTDLVAEKLSEQLAHRHRLDLTIMQKIGAGVFAIVLVTIPTVIAKVLA